MAQLWVRDLGEWAIVDLDGIARRAIDFGSWASDGSASDPAGGGPRLVRIEDGVDPLWVLLTPPGTPVSLNGLRLLTGFRILRDRDEIRLGGGSPLYFSTETLAKVLPLPDGGRDTSCPRCKQVIEAGKPAVRCPGCGVWHHASEEYPCWTYAPTCALCPRPTGEDTGFQWTPEGL